MGTGEGRGEKIWLGGTNRGREAGPKKRAGGGGRVLSPGRKDLIINVVERKAIQ